MHQMYRRLTKPGRTALLAGFLAAPGLLIPSALPVFAQSATAGAIGGTVTDAGGALLPGTIVKATSKDSGVVRTAKANSQGEYRLSELPPGTYTVTYTADGFDLAQQDNVVVTIGSLSNVSPKMTVGSVTSKVEVSDESPLLHTESNDVSTTIDQDKIDNLPINGRRWSSFALLTPGVVSNGDGFGLLSFRGISYLLNNSTVDGADNNQAYFSEERGRTRASYTISQAAVQEFQVNTSNYSAEYGRAAGGVINTVTKSGGNQFHGELFFYDRDNQWGASNPYTQLEVQNPSTGVYGTQNYKPKDWRKQWGFGVGGPIIKDKLFWFYSYDQSRRNFPGTGRASDPYDTFAPVLDTTLPAGTTCNGTAITPTPTNQLSGDAEACRLSGYLGVSYQAATTYYAQGLNVIANELGYVPRFADQVLNFPKLEWQVNDRNRATFEYNRVRFTSPAGLQTQASNFYGRASFGNNFVKTDFGLFRFTSVLTNSIVNEFRAQYGRDFEYNTSQPPLPNEVPLSNNQFNRPPDIQIGYYFDLTGFDIGKPYLLDQLAYPDERRIQVSDGITWSHGRHTTKFGVDINRVYDHTNNLYEGNGSYSYDYNADFIADYLHTTTGLNEPNGSTVYSLTQGFGNPQIAISTTDYNGYISDDWRITPRLTINAGLRYEYEYIPPNPYVNTGNQYIANAFNNVNGVTTGQPSFITAAATALPQTASQPDDRNNFGPRVGFAWNVYGDGKTTLRGGYGMYYGRVINAAISLAYQNSGSPLGQITVTSYPGTTSKACTQPTSFPNIRASDWTGAQSAYQCGTSSGPSTSTVAYLDPHLQNPQVHEMDLALEQNLGWGSVLSITYMGSLGRELPGIFDQNAPSPGSNTVTYKVLDNLNIFNGNGAPTALPHGGRKAPLLDGSLHTFPFYTSARRNSYYYNIYDLQSRINSSYNALSFALNKRFSNSLSFLSSFTWAHALDFNPYLGTGYGSTAYLPLDPNNIRQDYGNSNLNVGQRFIFAAHYNPRYTGGGYKKYVLDGWGLSPIVQAQTGLPYSATTGGGSRITGASLSGPLGTGVTRLPKFDSSGVLTSERNIFNMPKTATLDFRLAKSFPLDAVGQHFRFEVFAELFNALNHQNITSVNTGAYLTCNAGSSSTTGQAEACPAGLTGAPASTGSNVTGYLVFNNNFGTYKNSNSNTIYTPRQLQIAARLHF